MSDSDFRGVDLTGAYVHSDRDVPPALFVRIARALEWTHSAVVESLLHHAKHHDFPAIPCGQLGAHSS